MSNISKISSALSATTVTKIGGVAKSTIISVNGSVPDGIDGYTGLLMHMDGSDDGTVFTDDSPSSHSITRVNTVTKTGVKKLGTASMYCDGTGDYLHMSDNMSDFSFGSGNFTVEFWAYVSGSTAIAFVSKGGGASAWGDAGHEWLWSMDANGQLAFGTRDDGAGGQDYIAGPTPWAALFDSWHHYAVTQDAAFVRLYVDGILKTTGTTDARDRFTITNSPTTQKFLVAEEASISTEYTGYIDELRVSKGVARWTGTASFTPPTAPYV
ncbi:hypothetical protein LCGC14_0614170 [marine sediment metagenome]|uniref:LamG-like jellyroll fold domain-containing protein n=1 Tax=marine sediment metagenome TaxID=412755 RepID=A0A0F9TT90_9ZZZZ